MIAPFTPVRRRSLRVALASAGIVAVLYALVSLLIVGIVSGNLTDQVDQRLTATLQRIVQDPARPVPLSPSGSFDEGNNRFGPVLLIWAISADGSIQQSDAQAPLPAAYQAVRQPTTISIAGQSVRIDGASVAGVNVVVGESLIQVGQARGTVIVAELLVAPMLLLLVFLGAFFVGNRVGEPIDAARRRQLEFTADASHELRTPLSVIDAHANLALAQARDTEWYRNAFVRVSEESARMRRLVEDMLWLARFDATGRALATEPTDIGVLAEQAVDRFATVAEARGLGLSVSVDSSDVVVAPPEWLDRLLGVLIDNACKYAPDQGTVRVTVTRGNNRVRLCVEDSGPGIPPEERARIFDRFHRATDMPGGAGLGLAIADSVVRASHGRWEIGSSALGGASIAVSWPRWSKEPRAAAPAPDPGTVESPEPGTAE